jgi:hypothetical protein
MKKKQQNQHQLGKSITQADAYLDVYKFDCFNNLILTDEQISESIQNLKFVINNIKNEILTLEKIKETNSNEY